MTARRGGPAAAVPPDRTPGRTLSGVPVDVVYGPDVPPEAIGEPGAFPYTRGPYASMHRGRLWTMRMFAGFGTATETNERFRHLLGEGQTGLSAAFDMPTLMGLDSDDPRALGEVGREGVAVDSVEDVVDLFAGIPLDEVTVSMTINAPAPMLLAMYRVAAERRGFDAALLGGTIQADILKEYIAQKEWIYPVEPAFRISVDMIEWATAEMPRFHPLSVSGYHIREAGSTAAQELAFTLADGFEYVQACAERGLDVDAFAPRFSFFFNAQLDFFEEIAKYRAARRIWARTLATRFGARDERSLRLRFHAQTAGVSLTAQQPLLNVARTSVEALAAILGGCQSLHTNSYDEALALPTEEAATLALRTQQVLAYEHGASPTADPLGGSWFVEAMTDRIEAEALELLERIDGFGGVRPALEAGFFAREIADAAFAHQRAVETGERIVVGVNSFRSGEDPELALHRTDPAIEQRQRERVGAVRARRNGAAVETTLAELARVAERGGNVMPALVDAATASATLGEMTGALVPVFGRYRETPAF